MDIIVKNRSEFRPGMSLRPGVIPNSSLPAFSKALECEVALHRMSNNELWLVEKRGAVWETVRLASEEDAYSFVQANLAILNVP